MSGRARKVVGLLCLLALVAGAGYYFWPRAKPAPKPVALPPEIPAFVVDPDVRAALTAAREKLLAEPQSAQAWGELGWSFRAHNLNVESNACFAVAAKLDPKDPRWPYLIGVINLLIAPDDAIPHLRTAYDLATEPAHKSLTRLRLAEALLDRNDLDGAAKLFNEEAQANPFNPRAQFGLGAIAAARGDSKAAIAALQLPLESPFAHRKSAASLAATHRRLGNITEAERLEQEAARSPEDLPWPDPFLTDYLRRESGRSARMKLVEELEAKGRLPEAVAELEDVARDNPDDQVLVSLGINLAKMRAYERAERILRTVLARTPDHAVAHYFLGISLYMPAEAAWEKGNRDWAKPRFEEAITELRKSAALKPDKGLANLYAGRALMRLDKLPEALAECEAAVKATPHLADTHLGLGEVLLAMGKPVEAVPHLETAARLSLPGDTRAKTLLDKIAKKP